MHLVFGNPTKILFVTADSNNDDETYNDVEPISIADCEDIYHDVEIDTNAGAFSCLCLFQAKLIITMYRSLKKGLYLKYRYILFVLYSLFEFFLEKWLFCWLIEIAQLFRVDEIMVRQKNRNIDS